MKVCVAQVKSIKAAVWQNLENHLWMLEQILPLKADLVVFPELSITGYEPRLAKDLVMKVDSEIFQPVQKIADQNNMAIGIGLPTSALDGINISLLIFQAHQERLVYAKQMLHEDEWPYFVGGKEEVFLNIKGTKIAFGICYETLQRAHFVKAMAQQAKIYIASVAKPARGLAKAMSYFPALAKEFKTPILMANGLGFCDDFLSAGKSAVWNDSGELLAQLDEDNQGFLIYDTELGTVAQITLEEKA